MTRSEAPPSIRLQLALDQIRSARAYTLELLTDLQPQDWFAMPGGVTHVAWQVGHLAMAEYRLFLDRIRGERDSDGQIISPAMLAHFGKGATPEADATKYPPAEEILATLHRVHAAALDECSHIDDAELDLPPLKPHRLFDTKLGALLWCTRHEMVHAGQIGILRRLLGRRPLW